MGGDVVDFENRRTLHHRGEIGRNGANELALDAEPRELERSAFCIAAALF